MGRRNGPQAPIRLVPPPRAAHPPTWRGLDVRLPTYEELAREEEQLNVLEHPLDQSLFVVGPPGSGKTVLAIQRVQMVKEAMGSASVVTYNRMLRRLLALLGEGTDASTFHRFVSKDFYDRARESIPKEPRDSYKYLWTDIFIALDKIGASPNRKHLVVDEGQDLPEGFYQYVSQYVSETMTVFADEDQALSGERTTLEQIKKVAGLDDPIILKRIIGIRQRWRGWPSTSTVAGFQQHNVSVRRPERSRDLLVFRLRNPQLNSYLIGTRHKVETSELSRTRMTPPRPFTASLESCCLGSALIST